MKRYLFFLLAFFLLFNAILGGTLFYGWYQFNNTGTLSEDTTFVLERGTGLRAIAKKLQNAGVIENDLAFILGVRVNDQATSLKAGEYAFTKGMTGADVMKVLVSGKTVPHFITIPEGLQSREIRNLLENSPGLVGKLTEPLPEGSVLPETYHFSLGDSRNAVALKMKKDMTATLDALWAGVSPKGLIKSKRELLILASIVEKETGLASERDHVAGVFLNRISKKMRLQSDPTVVYGITKGKSELGRPISRKDLAAINDFNTYTLKGLPIGPICNPGLDSLKAVLSAKKTKDLYFVANGKGGHVFSKTLAEHNRNVRKWRKLQKKK
ncbi:MAG: endolytic transglycosylase MltG [Sneathiella sp.]|nr:endolytic transglycosylase MltG [Sneathiella sp.]